VTVFILPPSINALRKRLEMRGSDSQAVIEKRLINAKKEMAQKKMYRHIIVNDELSAAIDEICAIFNKYRQ
jgi:guanylate kinase